MGLSETIKKQLSAVAEQAGMEVDKYANWLGTEMPHASGADKAKIAGQIYKSGACPLLGHAVVMAHGSSHTLAVTYDGWVALGLRDGITGINCEILEKENEPWAVKATVNKGEQIFSRLEVIEENRAMGARGSKAWKNMPLRMTQHRAIVSAIRCACSINSMASVEELQDAGFKQSTNIAPPVVKAAEKVFQESATVKPKPKLTGTATINVKGEKGKSDD